MRPAFAACLALLGACGSSPLVAHEPGSPDLRVVALFPADGPPTVEALAGSEPFRATLDPSTAHELWSFHFAAASLRAEYPAIQGLSTQEILPRLAPRFVDPALDPPEPPPVPDRVLRLNLSAGQAGGAVDYQELTWTDWQAQDTQPPRRPFALGISRVDPACSRLKSTVWPAPPGVLLEAAAPLSGDRALAMGSSGDGPTSLWRLDADGPTQLPSPPGVVGRVRSLASAGGDVIYGLANSPLPDGGNLFALDAQGQLIPRPLVVGSGARAMVRAGADGYVLVSTDQGVVEFARGATVARPRADLPEPPQFLHVVRRDRVIAVDGRGLIFSDGFTWSVEHLFTFTERPLGLGGDETLLVTGESGLVLRRDELTRTWSALPALPRTPRLLLAGASLGPDTFVIVGSPGVAVVWMGTAWCPLQAGVGTVYFAAARAPGARVAWAVAPADVARGQPEGAFLRVELAD